MMAIMLRSLADMLRHSGGIERRFATGQHLFSRGERVAVLHLVVEGEARLLRIQPDGTPLVLQRAGPETVLAEASLFSDFYHCDAVARVPTRTIAAKADVLRKQLDDGSPIGSIWASHLAREVQSARLRAEILRLRTVAERLDAWLTMNDGRLPPKGRWTVIADEIGTSPEALYREIGRRRGGGRMP